MKNKFFKTISIIQALVLLLGLSVFTMPMTADADSLGVTPSDAYRSSVYYQRACAAYSSYADPVTRFVQVALSQTGYKGGTYSGDWSGVGGSNGKGGPYTEYSRFMGVDGQQWCASFVSWCAAAAGIPTDVISRYAGAGDWRKWPGNGTFTFLWSNNFTTYVDYKPQVGDLCMYMPYHDVSGCQKHYNANSPTSHVVIVAWVSDTKNADGSYTFTTIERGSSTDGNIVASNTLTTKTTRTSAGTCACGLQTPANQYSYTVQGFYRPNWSLMGDTVLASGKYDGITWEIDSNYTLTITGTGEMTQMPWRDSYNNLMSQIRTIKIGEGITSIGAYAFQDCSSITGVTIPGSVKNIGRDAFNNCTSLKTVYISEGVEVIGDNAFFNCISLSWVNIPESITKVGHSAFQNCSSLTSATLPAGVELGSLIYTDCSNVNNIVIEEGVEAIPSYTFYGTAITSVNIPESVTGVGANAFGNCTRLTDVYLSVSQSKWENSVTVGDKAFPDGVSFHYKYPELQFKVENINGNEVVLAWNHIGGVLYSVKIYAENGLRIKSYTLSDAGAVNGKITLTTTLESGKYRAGITVDSQASNHDAEIEFEVKNKDSENYKVESLSGTVVNGRFFAEVEVVNVTDRNEADTVIIAVYKDDEMIDYVYMKTDLPKGQTVVFGGMLEGVEGATLKAFVWDSIQDMKALSNVVEK
ncbi:MAG: leucine-rich repeat protein [Clostridia bacterium]|nr:leucine-rich repeat protein [Clostridia bacterium]